MIVNQPVVIDNVSIVVFIFLGDKCNRYLFLFYIGDVRQMLDDITPAPAMGSVRRLGAT